MKTEKVKLLKRRAKRRKFVSIFPLKTFVPPVVKANYERVFKPQPYYSFELSGHGIHMKIRLENEDDFKILDAIVSKLKNEIAETNKVHHESLSLTP